MRWLLLTLLLLNGAPAPAQENALRLPVNVLNGQVLPPLTPTPDPASVVKARIQSLRIRWVSRLGTGYDTSHRGYRMVFTSQGDLLPYHQEFRDFDGFNNILYHKNGSIASSQWQSRDWAGCGTGGRALLYNEHHKEYTYHKGRLVQTRSISMTQGTPLANIPATAGIFVSYAYDRNGRLLSETQYAFDTLPTKGIAWKHVTRYRYDKRGQPLQVFSYDSSFSQAPAIMDSLIDGIPDDFNSILLRKAYRWREYGLFPKIPDTAVLTEEEEEKRKKAFDDRDSADSALSDFYLDDHRNYFQNYKGYEYALSGLLTGLVHFEKDELSRRDTFVYDSKQHLVRWESWHLEYGMGREPWEEAGIGQQPQHWIWQFHYDDKGRVDHCRLERSWSPQPNYSNEQYRFRIEEESLYRLYYDDKGRVSRVGQEQKNHHYDMNPEVIPPVTTDSTTYLIDYEPR